MNTDEVIEIVNYLLDNKCSIRSAAKFFNIPKSTIHNHLTVIRKESVLDKSVLEELDTLMKENRVIGPIQGGYIAHNLSVPSRSTLLNNINNRPR